MNEIRTYHILIGSKAFFDSKLPDFDEYDDVHGFLELVRILDKNKQSRSIYYEQAQILIIKNDNYHGIVEAAHDRIGALIEELTTNNADIYIHNPPVILKSYLKNQKERGIINLFIESETYTINRNSDDFAQNMINISNIIIGQENAIEEISKSMWYLTNTNRIKPYVIMLYGGSSLGKTELVKEIANKFFDGKFLEKHLSMFKNNIYSDYFFGDKPNRRSIGFDLLERQSNLIFFDELDKCPDYFYSAFYTLFDNTLFKDATYDVDISGLLIVLTSNYQSEDDLKKNLGLPIFYRIDKLIHFDNFSCNTIYSITMNEIISRYDEYGEKFTSDQVYSAASRTIKTDGENARTIKCKVQNVIEELLFKEVRDSLQVELKIK